MPDSPTAKRHSDRGRPAPDGLKLRVLQVIPSLNPRMGGPVEGLIQQGMEMVRNGHDVQTLSLDPPGSEFDKRLHSSAVYMLGPPWLKYGFAPGLASWLREHARRFDIVVIHGMWTYHGFCAATVCRQQGVPYVMFLHGMLDPWFAREYPLKHLKKWLYWPWAEYRNIRDARYVLFTTSEEMRLARDSFWMYKARERLVGYGIRNREVPPSQARPAFLNQFQHLTSTRNLLYLSRLHPKKGCDVLIRSFARLAALDENYHLILAGPGEHGYVQELRALVDQQRLSGRVTFTGMLTGDVKWGAYDSSEAFALTSHQENFGIVLAEALASGLPVLTTRQVNIWREVSEAQAGLIDSDDQDGADRLLMTWHAMDSVQRSTMARNARDCYNRHFDVRSVTEHLLQALQDAVREPPSSHTFSGWRFRRRSAS